MYARLDHIVNVVPKKISCQNSLVHPTEKPNDSRNTMKSRRGFLNLQQPNCVTRLPAQIIWYFALTVFLLFGSAVFLVADEVPDEVPDKAAPSAFAPAKDLEQQITYFVKRLDKQLADEADYNEDRQINVERDASTLAVIAVVLANHDQPGELKASALLSSAQSLVEAAGDYAEAIQSLQALKDALAVKEDSASVDWESSGVDLSVLMKQALKLCIIERLEF